MAILGDPMIVYTVWVLNDESTPYLLGVFSTEERAHEAGRQYSEEKPVPKEWDVLVRRIQVDVTLWRESE